MFDLNDTLSVPLPCTDLSGNTGPFHWLVSQHNSEFTHSLIEILFATNFAYDMKAVLSWHVQNSTAIWWPVFEFFIEFELWAKGLGEMGLWPDGVDVWHCVEAMELEWLSVVPASDTREETPHCQFHSSVESLMGRKLS